MYYAQEYIICGKPRCWCANAPRGKMASGGRAGHGPYWYAYWIQRKRDGTRKLRKKYIGKILPEIGPDDTVASGEPDPLGLLEGHRPRAGEKGRGAGAPRPRKPRPAGDGVGVGGASGGRGRVPPARRSPKPSPAEKAKTTAKRKQRPKR